MLQNINAGHHALYSVLAAEPAKHPRNIQYVAQYKQNPNYSPGQTRLHQLSSLFHLSGGRC